MAVRYRVLTILPPWNFELSTSDYEGSPYRVVKPFHQFPVPYYCLFLSYTASILLPWLYQMQ